MPSEFEDGGRKVLSARPRKVRGVEIAAREALAEHIHFRGRADQFELTAYEEALVVRGSVPSFYLKQMLQTVLQNVEGVRQVHNRVVVISSQGLSSAPGERRSAGEGWERTGEPCAMSTS
jgi:hypothetical protein